jgi:hypothetical protein
LGVYVRGGWEGAGVGGGAAQGTHHSQPGGGVEFWGARGCGFWGFGGWGRGFGGVLAAAEGGHRGKPKLGSELGGKRPNGKLRGDESLEPSPPHHPPPTSATPHAAATLPPSPPSPPSLSTGRPPGRLPLPPRGRGGRGGGVFGRGERRGADGGGGGLLGCYAGWLVGLVGGLARLVPPFSSSVIPPLSQAEFSPPFPPQTHPPTSSKGLLPPQTPIPRPQTQSLPLGFTGRKKTTPQEFSDYASRLYAYLSTVENRLFSEGLHVLGAPPGPDQMAAYLAAYFGDRLPRQAVDAVASGAGAARRRAGAPRAARGRSRGWPRRARRRPARIPAALVRALRGARSSNGRATRRSRRRRRPRSRRGRAPRRRCGARATMTAGP